MKKYVNLWLVTLYVAVLWVIVLAASVFGGEAVGMKLQRSSVNILAGNAQGSGTIFLSEVSGESAAFVITANHVVDGQRRVTTVIGNDGITKKVVHYDDASVIQEQVLSGRTVGEIKFDARIISIDARRDIALLRVRKGDFTTSGASFYLGESIPSAGTEIYHAGAPGGKETGGSCTLTGGIVSRVGVRIPSFGGGSEYGIFDQTDTAALGGSSGGMVALKSDGRWIGMITLGLRGGGDNFHWFVPARAVSDWAEEVNVMWLFDESLPRPTEGDVSGIVLENVESSKGSSK